MRNGIVCLLIVLCVGLLAVASCHFSDSPDCGCFDNTATWNPTGTWIQDIALDTVGTIVSCVTDGGKPFYQMRLGLGSASSANTMASILEALSSMGMNPYEREAWCSEAISYWHREAEIPYTTGYRGSDWHLDWQLTNTNAIRTFYMVEELLDSLPFMSGRGRWIEWSDLDYSDFQPGINAPAPGSYVLIRKYDDTNATWDGKSHSMMIDEMTIHQNGFGDVVEVEVTLLQGNAGSPAQVLAFSSLDDLISYTPGGSEWLSSSRKILGFGVDLDRHGSPVYDPDRLHYERDLFVVAPAFKPFLTKDPMWSRLYAPLVQKLVEYATKVIGGPGVTGPGPVIGKGSIPDGQGASWAFGPELNRTQPNGFAIEVDLLQDHPLPLKGIALRWEGAIPIGYSVRYAADGERYQDAALAGAESIRMSGQQLGGILIPIPFGKESKRVRKIQLYFPPGSVIGESQLTEMRFIYDWGPSDEAEFNPSVLGQKSDGPLSIEISTSASDVQEAAYSDVVVVSWKISGGALPYKLIIRVTGPDGVTVAEGDNASEGTRSFKLAYPKGGTVLVSAEVEDAAGASASGMTSVSLE